MSTVDYGALNHMTSHEEWFSYLQKLEQLGVVETGDDTPHPIEPVKDVPLIHVGQKGRFMNVLHVPTITKNMMSVRQIVTKGCRSGSPTSGALSRKKAKSSCKATRREDVLRNDQPKPAYTYAIWVQRSRMTKTCKTECTSTETHNLTWKT